MGFDAKWIAGSNLNEIHKQGLTAGIASLTGALLVTRIYHNTLNDLSLTFAQVGVLEPQDKLKTIHGFRGQAPRTPIFF